MARHSKGKGQGITFLQANVGFEGADCLLWPFYRKRDGYGIFGHEGAILRANRWMCEATHGAAPSPRHEAAHSCGNAGCVNPRHLSWKTSAENHIDKIKHGTTRTGKGRPFRKLTTEQVQAILRARGEKSDYELAKLYGISDRHVRSIWQDVVWRGGVPHLSGGRGAAPHSGDQ